MSVLDGGLAKWVAEERVVETSDSGTSHGADQPPNVAGDEMGQAELPIDRSLVARLSDMHEIVGAVGHAETGVATPHVIDARAGGRFGKESSLANIADRG